ncbi:putative Ankyrin repeat family protein [Quillaja saponaria]|uniref:Ankyrin repeat family protein n=1 Tax=Quillaja saponaria TaxID=32244 RepID=A0AAD7VJL2_QUISA|nr:putative Ankyrin repeat family protein [Quillaja saponaria]
MDMRLYEAAEAGDIQILHQLLTEDPLILHTASIISDKNPLHIASIAGHVDFAKEILRLKPDLSKELDQHGVSPVHTALANGYLEIIRELLKVDGKLCRIKGIENKTPLHYAAIKGRVDIINEMILASPESLEDMTVQRETALHLAVKFSQFEAIKLLVDWAREIKKEDILNWKDEQGNTILHLATWKKQRQVIELLLGNGTKSVGIVEVNATNYTSLTALDLLLIFPSEAGDREIKEILRGANAIRARDQQFSHVDSFSCSNQSPSTSGTRASHNLMDYFKFKRGRDSPSDARTALLVVVVLVTTSAFQVGLNPPGGVWQDGNLAGKSIMGSKEPPTFAVFAVFNSIMFTVSLVTINILTTNFPMRLELLICMSAMFVTYNIAIIGIAPESIKVFLTVFTSVLPTVVEVVVKQVRQIIVRVKELVANIVQKISSIPN